MRQDADPEVTAREQVRRAQDQPSHAGVDDDGGFLVVAASARVLSVKGTTNL
jgi:hypothetical protein